MLRQALDAAERHRTADSSNDNVPPPDSESTSLAQDSGGTASTSRGDYGSTSLDAAKEEEEDDEFDDDDGDSYATDEQSESTLLQRSRVEAWLGTAWKKIKDFFVLILNVDNLWDEEAGFGEALTRSDHMVVFFWFFLLATSYAGERSTFYLIVDRTGPFRLFSAEMITASHAILLCVGMMISAISRRDFHLGKLGIPLVDVARK
jgi:hypothetical protein